MPISWNEIRSNAIAFAREWAGEEREHAEANTFWDAFFKVFGLTRRHLASFQEPVRNIRGQYSYIDLFWKGILLAEHKSAGKDLGKAHSQAMDYIQDLQRDDRADEVPQYVIVSDFRRIALHDLESNESHVFGLGEFHQNIHLFGFIPGYKQQTYEPQDPINLKAVQIMGDLHDALEAGGYTGHELERFLVRILFCLFAEDTGIFTRATFQLFLENHTDADGSDLGANLAQLFSVLNTPSEKRQEKLREELADLPYVNGELFSEQLGFAEFNRDMRNQLLACTRFDWSRISPAVFGALFQSVMEPKERRQIGAHYTSERDILKVIGPLFLDDLKVELESAGKAKRKLEALQDKVSATRMLDPACGCGNFLVIAYRELRRLELEIIKRLHPGDVQKVLHIEHLSKVNVDQFYGIEILEWPSRIAEVAMWLMDHQMNNLLSVTFGGYYARLPLTKSPHIRIGNALRIDWNDVLPAGECNYVLGNPPFVGKKEQTDEQKADMDLVWDGIKGSGVLDYVTAWYSKATTYIQDSAIRCAFVSTNSITQGEQVGTLWNSLFSRGIRIQFAHRTFEWESEAKGRAHVHVVVIGFGVNDVPRMPLFDYQLNKESPTVTFASKISPYLIDGTNTGLLRRDDPVCKTAPTMMKGSEVTDDGHLLLSDEERQQILTACPESGPFIRQFTGGFEFINRATRWCLWLRDAPSSAYRRCTEIRNRLEAVKQFRMSSKKARTVELASAPNLFGEDRQPNSNYLLVPKVSSERRQYIPIGFLEPVVIVSGSALVVPNASMFEFGMLSSRAHMDWMRTTCGRMKSDYQYSVNIVYNNFPWPQDVTDKQREKVESAAQQVLDVRSEFPDSTLADLYDPLSMPAKLARAHTALDKAVDHCYRSQPFPTERHRIEYLFELYQQLTKPLMAKPKKSRTKKAI